MSNLLIEIGNTALKAAWSEGKTLGKIFRYQGEKTMDFILSITEKQIPDILTISSTRVISDKEREILRGQCGKLMLLDTDCRRSDYGLPEYLPFDRVASIIAARYMFMGKPCTICDFGTTLTIDFITASGEYEGGNISPGFTTRFKALSRYSRNLPTVNIPHENSTLGTSVVSSIESGVVLGIMFEIDGYIQHYPDNIVIFTGGDAFYFAKKAKNSIFAICNLVLMGLAIITEDYDKKALL